MRKLFFSNLLLVLGINLLIKPLYIFGIDRSVQNAVGPSEYGLYFALFNFVYLFQFFNDFGVQNFHHSVFSKYDFLIPKYLPKILATKLFLGLGFAMVTTCSAVLFGFAEYIWPLLLIIVLNQFLASLIIYIRTTLSAFGHYSLDSLLSVADKIIMILVLGHILWYETVPMTILLFAMVQTLSFFLSMLTACFILYRRMGVPAFRFKFEKAFSIFLLRKSLPYALVLFLMTLYTRMDGVMIERMLPDGKTEAGIYAASYRILDALSMIGLLVAGLLLPMFAKLIRKKEAVDELVEIARNILLSFSIVMVSISFFYHQEIITALYSGANVYWGSVYRLLLFSYWGVCLSYIYGTLLTANESISTMNRIFVVGVLLNLCLNFLFITWWKAWGAALATVITQILTSLALMIYAHHQLRLSPNPGGWIRILAFSILIFILGWRRLPISRLPKKPYSRKLVRFLVLGST